MRSTQTTAPQVISHYNLFRSAEINGSRGAGLQLGPGDRRHGDAGQQVLPRASPTSGRASRWKRSSSGSQTLIIFGLGLLFVYLVLSAQYESFALPFIILLAVPLALLGALAAQSLRGLANDVYCQIGLVMLIGLASKNAILIVEFAEQLREQRNAIVEAAIEAARSACARS